MKDRVLQGPNKTTKGRDQELSQWMAPGNQKGIIAYDETLVVDSWDL